MDTTPLDQLLQELDEADPADAADLAVKAAETLNAELDEEPQPEEPA